MIIIDVDKIDHIFHLSAAIWSQKIGKRNKKADKFVELY